jgi:hypothetical protein
LTPGSDESSVDSPSDELSYLQRLKSITGAMRASILARDMETLERATGDLEAAAAAAPAGPAALEESRRIAREVRAEGEAIGALLADHLEAIDRIVRLLAAAPDPGTYGPGAGATDARRARPLLDRAA